MTRECILHTKAAWTRCSTYDARNWQTNENSSPVSQIGPMLAISPIELTDKERNIIKIQTMDKDQTLRLLQNKLLHELDALQPDRPTPELLTELELSASHN